MDIRQNFFISHATADKARYIQPLAERLTELKVTFWLDSLEMGWGDSLALKINQGLRDSRYVVICLSKAFMKRPWPEMELNTAFTMMQNQGGNKKVLPLILNNKDDILMHYPLIAGLVYREYENADTVAEQLANLVGSSDVPADYLHVVIESLHTGRLSNLQVPPRASIKWLAEQAKSGAGLKDSLDTGGFQPYRIRWVLVDANAESNWRAMDRGDKRHVRAIVSTQSGIKVADDDLKRLNDIGVYNDIVFHLYAVEDEHQDDICFAPPDLK
jgi:hypothetical protein